MVDNVTITTADGDIDVATREVAGVHYQRVVPAGGALTDQSGAIAAGGTSEEVAAANDDRVYLLVQNVSDTAMWVNFGTAAVAGQPSIYLAPNGGSIAFEGTFCPTGTVNIICATTGKTYTAKEA